MATTRRVDAIAPTPAVGRYSSRASCFAGLKKDEELKKTFHALAEEEATHKLSFEVEYEDVIIKEG